MNGLFHTVLITFKEGTLPETKNTIYHLYQTLARNCGGKEAGILFWKVDWNLDKRKNVELVEVAIFENNETFQTFRSHPSHQQIVTLLAQVADWQVGDIMIDSIPL